MEQKDVMPRHNARILDSVSKKNVVDFGVASECKAKSYSDFVSLSVTERTDCLAANKKYLKRTEEENTAVRLLLFIVHHIHSKQRPRQFQVLSLWVIADLDTAEGREFLRNAVKRLNVSKKMRLGIVMNPANEHHSCGENSATFLVHAALKLLPHNHAKHFITEIAKLKNVEDIKNLEDIISDETERKHFNSAKQLLGCDQIKMESQ
ncbi:hypothetical protein ANCCAN_12843 [Ancylostoma caninum]|uniref:UDP-glucose:glycoprotein glucosyltransferase thioredoxin-like domain-containing protein n=1 Tax=Ancylostoma caninum TaxID=29170 RepID=A0A368GDX0_ANCCA|nr:hypothetical protein ANCCAN_12843 [Ancylostoma caninum]